MNFVSQEVRLLSLPPPRLMPTKKLPAPNFPFPKKSQKRAKIKFCRFVLYGKGRHVSPAPSIWKQYHVPCGYLCGKKMEEKGLVNSCKIDIRKSIFGGGLSSSLLHSEQRVSFGTKQLKSGLIGRGARRGWKRGNRIWKRMLQNGKECGTMGWNIYLILCQHSE